MITKLTIRKFILKFEYLNCEYEEISDLFKIYLEEFNNFYKKELNQYINRVNKERFKREIINSNYNNETDLMEPNKNLSLYVNDNIDSDNVESDSNINLNNNDINIDNHSELSKIKKIIKKLYHSISILTHPDKIKDDNLNKLFVLSQNAYENDNLIQLLSIQVKLDIDFQLDLDNDCIELIQDNINDLSNNIEEIKNKNAWVWYHKNEQDRALMTQQLYKLWEINPV